MIIGIHISHTLMENPTKTNNRALAFPSPIQVQPLHKYCIICSHFSYKGKDDHTPTWLEVVEIKKDEE